MKKKTYKQVVESLFKLEIVKDYSLVKILKATHFFWNPQDDSKIIHITWTNGKWSVSKMVFSVLKEAWEKVWVFTSPHLVDIRERFETHDWLIKEDEFIEIVNKIMESKMDLSYFERCFLIALLHFQKKQCDYVVLEVWVWWLFDTTNIVNPIITAITSVWYDHLHLLWTTLEEISMQKAWIIKENIPIVINHRNSVIEKIAKQNKSPIIFSDKRIKTNLLWEHQEKNAWVAYEICKNLGIEKNIILNWLQKVKHFGRLQFVRDNLLVDWAHNIDSLISLKNYIEKNLNNKFEKIYYCFWLKKWKIPDFIYDIFQKDKNYIWVDFQSDILEDLSKYKDLRFLKVGDIKKMAIENKKNLYLVFGSLYMIGEFLK